MIPSLDVQIDGIKELNKMSREEDSERGLCEIMEKVKHSRYKKDQSHE